MDVQRRGGHLRLAEKPSGGASGGRDFIRQAASGDAAAVALLYDRFSDQVNRTLWRLLGADPDHDDLVNEVFLRILDRIEEVREPEKLRGWVLSITVNIARAELRKRSLRRRFLASQRGERTMSHVQDPEARALLARTFELLDRMPTNLRVVFALRYIDDQPLATVAESCGCSLATVKRRLEKAQKRFTKLARREPELCERLERGRWGAS